MIMAYKNITKHLIATIRIMIEYTNKTSTLFSIELLQEIADSLTDKEIELMLTDNSEIQQINREFRHKDTPTDVISFPYKEMPMSPLGSIVISLDYVDKGAERYGHSREDEFTLLFIHGLLHLLGYNHECDRGEMRQKEKEIIETYSLPSSLIVRTAD